MAAEGDLLAGKSFYEAQCEGLGEYFIDSILGDLATLRLHGGVHRKVYGFHRLLCQRFPFAVYYDLTEDVVRVAAVLDMRKSPTWIQNSLRKRPKKP